MGMTTSRAVGMSPLVKCLPYMGTFVQSLMVQALNASEGEAEPSSSSQLSG